MNKGPYDSLNARDDTAITQSRLIAQREVDDLKWLMSNKRGRRIAYQLLHDAGVFRISFSNDALQMAFNEGNRNNGLKILNTIIVHCPTRYAEMIEEATHA